MPTFITNIVAIILLGIISQYNKELVAYGIVSYMFFGQIVLVLIGVLMSTKQWKEVRNGQDRIH